MITPADAGCLIRGISTLPGLLLLLLLLLPLLLRLNPLVPCCCAPLLQTLGNCLLRDISTLPGLLLLVLLANQAAGFAAVLTTGLLSPAALVAAFQVGCCV